MAFLDNHLPDDLDSCWIRGTLHGDTISLTQIQSSPLRITATVLVVLLNQRGDGYIGQRR